jgi:glycosyltransferase involved in cell wall biosynthesis
MRYVICAPTKSDHRRDLRPHWRRSIRLSPVTRPSLLFLSQTLPFPPDSGVSIRTFNILRLLAREFDVTALCFYRHAERSTVAAVRESVEHLSRYAHTEAFPIPQEHSAIRRLADHAASVALRRAYTLRAYESAAFRNRTRAVLAEKAIDLVHVDSMDLAGYFPLVRHLPVACTHHNVESLLLRRRAAALGAFRRIYLSRQADWTEEIEREWCGRMALNVTVSHLDGEALSAIAPNARITVVPNGVDTETFRPTVEPVDGVIFVGGANWFPNADALEYFASDILPAVRALGANPAVRWVGRSSPAQQRHYGHEGIELTGYVVDARPLIASSACYVVPLRIGGGTRLKILDAWAMGKAVVSTSIGCEGLEAIDGENILVRDTPASFASAVNDVLHNADLRDHLGRGARRTAERVYSWDVIGIGLSETYLSLLQQRGRNVPRELPAI